MALVCGFKVTGASHKNKGTDCQDSFAYENKGFAVIAAVADGIGSESHSGYGSKTASEAAVSYCAENIHMGMEGNSVLKVIYQSFDHAWRAVEQGANEYGFDVGQCNTTLTLAVHMDGDVYYGHAGDSGIFAFYDDGTVGPVTTPQNDSAGRVFTLSSGPGKWEFEKVPKRAVSLLLCTDGIWGMFFPERLAREREKHSVPLLAWYIDPEAIRAHSLDGFHNWLESDMKEINAKSPGNVNYDDLTIVIMHDDRIKYTRQPEAYYEPPTEEELEQAKQAEHERLYGHLTTPTTVMLLLEKACEYDANYRFSTMERTFLAQMIFEELIRESKPAHFGKKAPLRYPWDIFITSDRSSKTMDIKFGNYRIESGEAYYRIIEQAAKLLTNGFSLTYSDNKQSVAYCLHVGGKNDVMATEELLSKELSSLFWKSFIHRGNERDAAQLPAPDLWLDAIKGYLSDLKPCGCKKAAHFAKTALSGKCPWCVIDKGIS